MINYRVIAIMKREVKAQIFSRKFIFMTLSIPIVLAIMIGVQFFLATYQSEEKSFLTVITESEQFQTQLQSRFQDSELNDTALFELTYIQASRVELEDYIDENRQALLDNELTGVVFIPDSAREDKKLEYYSSNPGNQILLTKFRTEINKTVIEQYFNERNIDQSSIDYARMNVDIAPIRVTTEGTADINLANLAVTAFLTFILYMSLIMAGQTVMGAVNEEKTNRVVEVLLSSVTSNELMMGKIIGTAIALLAQMLIWVSPLILLSIGSLPMLSVIGDFEIDINMFFLAYFLFNFLIGLLIYLSIFSVFGAIFDNPQEAQGSMMPVMMLIIIPFFLATTMVQNPANFLAEVASMLPFFSIIIMPARISLIDVPLWQVGLAIVMNIATFYFVVKLAGKLYRVTILVTGKRPSWKEMIKWIRYA